MHPDYLLDALTSKQISEWEAYDRLDPIGTWREDFRMAFLATMNNKFNDKCTWEERYKATDLKDFMPVWDIDAPKDVKMQDRRYYETNTS